MLKEGELLAGKYRIERHLGQGGMGYVVAAVHEQLQQRVAVKFLSKAHSKTSGASARFLREARAAVRIQSEHVARVLDVAETDAGEPYIVMEFLLGNDLDAELLEEVTFSVTTAVDYVLQACEAVAEAHSLGLVHRDLKPANLFLTRRADGSPLVKVLDFGISKALSEAESSGASLTSAQTILGSPAYMSPEQARKPKTVDMRTDIWSLGVILYQFLSGVTPFSGDTPLSILASAFVDPTPDLRLARPDLPAELELVVERCLQKDPEDRFQTVAELALALEPFAAPSSVLSIARIRNTIARPSSSIPPRILSVREASLTLADTEAAPSEEGSNRTSSASTQLIETAPTTALPGMALPKSRTLTEWGKSDSEPRRSRRLLVAFAGGLLLLVALFVRLVLQSSGGAGEGLDATAEKKTAAPVVTGSSLEQVPRASAPLVQAAPAAVPAEAPAPSAAPASSTSSAPVSSAVAPRQPATKTQKPRVVPPPRVTQEAEPDPLDGRR